VDEPFALKPSRDIIRIELQDFRKRMAAAQWVVFTFIAFAVVVFTPILVGAFKVIWFGAPEPTFTLAQGGREVPLELADRDWMCAADQGFRERPDLVARSPQARAVQLDV
jgi:hypothetical protein